MKKITLSNVKSFIRGHYNMYLDKLGAYPKHKQEQILYRISLCSDCVTNKGCKHCSHTNVLLENTRPIQCYSLLEFDVSFCHLKFQIKYV